MLRRETMGERRESLNALRENVIPRLVKIPVHAFACILFGSVAAIAAPKSSSAYYGDAAFQYIENRLPSAEITVNEGLQYYPNDQKLQMLLDRILEAKEEQKNENSKNDKNQDQNKNQDQEQNQDDGSQDKSQDKNQDSENGSSAAESSSSGNEGSENQQNGEGSESSSSAPQSSDSSGENENQPQEEPAPENPEDSESSGDSLVPVGEMTPEEANQLLKDFDEQNGERKPWKPIRGQRRPEKDW